MSPPVPDYVPQLSWEPRTVCAAWAVGQGWSGLSSTVREAVLQLEDVHLGCDFSDLSGVMPTH
eukprot:1158866-Pelagomonas_calceolata.AAC.2